MMIISGEQSRGRTDARFADPPVDWSDDDGEDLIRAVVFAFYGRVRADPMLGPVFEDRLHGRWEPHLEKMCAFWSSVLAASRRFHGDPIGVHAEIPGITPAHFDRWMELFTETAADVLPSAMARDIVGRSRRMRRALERTACPAHAKKGAE